MGQGWRDAVEGVRGGARQIALVMNYMAWGSVPLSDAARPLPGYFTTFWAQKKATFILHNSPKSQKKQRFILTSILELK